MVDKHPTIPGAIADQALAWHLACDRDDMDWDGFAHWLEADPRHRACYDEVALVDRMIAEHRPALADGHAATTPAPVRATGRWLAGALAAAAALAAVIVAMPRRIDDTVFSTGAAPGTIALADGSAITLAPHSRLVLSGADRDRITLDGGAYFVIRHRPQRELSIAAGALTIRDIGTSFDIETTRQPGGANVRIMVGSGRLTVRSAALAAPIELSAGHALRFDPSEGTATVEGTRIASVGSWRRGELSYENTPLFLVAADLQRFAGVAFAVDPKLQGQRFSGTLALANAKNAPRDLAQILDLDLVRGPDGPQLAPRQRH